MAKTTTSLFACALLAASLLSGCAGTKAASKEPVFFPPPPSDPHVQFLTTIRDSTDVEDQKSNFSLLATGVEKGNVIKRIIKGYGITEHKGKFYVTSVVGSQIAIIDFVNKSFEYLKGAKEGAGRLSTPIGIAFDKDDNLYVADSGRNEVVAYDPQGNFLRTYGKQLKSDQGKKHNIVGVAVYDDQIFILDSKTSELRVVDRGTGDELRVIGKDDKGTYRLGIPTNVTIDKDGYLWVSNIGLSNVAKFDRDGNYITSFGHVGDTPGSFTRPKGIAVDDDGWIYVVDAGWANVQVFANDGKTIFGYFGTPGLANGSLNLPAGVTVTKDNLDFFQKMAAPDFILSKVVLVVNQAINETNGAISIYGIGEKKKSATAPKKGDGETVGKAK